MSADHAQQPFGNDETNTVNEVASQDSSSVVVPIRSRARRATSSASHAGHSSYNLPSRSYIHSGHGSQGTSDNAPLWEFYLADTDR